ncbi:MAG: hypothetical protein GWO38_30370 [Phycisphaerae bacterium]|nr:hypothetical protein [Phycisphaerae bacterium]NIX31817.1 hypothetical protein [Phycisphaerae bacterium]
MTTWLEVKEIYRERVEAHLKDVDDEIRRLRARYDKLDDKIRLENDERFKALQAQQAVVREKLQSLDNASDVVWEELTKEVDQAVQELKKLVTNITSDLAQEEGNTQEND